MESGGDSDAQPPPAKKRRAPSRRDEDVGAIRGALGDILSRLEAMEQNHQARMESFEARLEAVETKNNNMHDATKELADMVMTLKSEWASRGKATSSTPKASGGEDRFPIPAPKPFNGVRKEEDISDFLYDLDRYFEYLGTPEERRVFMASLYLAGDAKIWWRQRSAEDAKWPPATLQEFVQELKATFMPHNTSWIAREELDGLRMTGAPREYVRKFSSLLLRITGMSEEDKLYRFVSGLPPWAKTELDRRNCKDLQSAYKMVEGLADLRSQKSEKSDEKRSGKWGGARPDRPESSGTANQQPKGKFSQKKGPRGQDKGKRPKLVAPSQEGGPEEGLLCLRGTPPNAGMPKGSGGRHECECVGRAPGPPGLPQRLQHGDAQPPSAARGVAGGSSSP